MARVYRKWTDEDRRLFMRLYPNTHNCDLALQFNVPICKIRKTALRYGVQKSQEYRKEWWGRSGMKLTDHEVDIVRQLKEEGMSVATIAEKMEIPRRYVYKLVNYERRASLIAPIRKKV